MLRQLNAAPPSVKSEIIAARTIFVAALMVA
jgi:hypothetical protein